MTIINYYTIPEFDKDFKRLGKRFRTLEKDFENVKKFVIEPHYLQGAPTTALTEIEGFCSEYYKSIKIRKFASLCLKNCGNRTGIRIIFVFEPDNLNVTFIEIYFKGDKGNEDKKRLSSFIKTLLK